MGFSRSDGIEDRRLSGTADGSLCCGCKRKRRHCSLNQTFRESIMNLPALLVLTISQLIAVSLCDDTPNATEVAKPPKPDVYELHVITDIKYRYATTVVTSRVANPADVAQEVGFTVVLPESAFITGFLMEIKDKVYEAYVKEKEEAKKEYDAAVSQGLGAGYVEQKARDSNQFTVSVNVEPHSKVNFNLTYDQLLTRTLGSYKHVVNINPGQIVRDMSVVVRINESSKLTKVEVPELQLDNEVTSDPEKKQNALAVITRDDPQTATVVWAPTPEQQKEIAKEGINGQLTVEYDVDRQNSQQILVEDGYFVHFFAPETLKPLPKHVIFVLDYSGSMLGKKIEQLKEAMATILTDLSSQDYFSLVIFSNTAQVWTPTLDVENSTTTPAPYIYDYNTPTKDQEITRDNIVPATPEKITLAKQHINTFSDYGGTNIIAGLRNGLKLADLGKEVLKNTALQPEPMIVFLTDGEPTTEIYDTEEIIKKVKELNTNNVTIFSLAFGYGADVKFLKKLSYNNEGFHRVIYEAADAASQLKNFYKEIASPLLSNITFNYVPSQVDQDSATRVDFSTFFNGSEIVVAGKLQAQDQPSSSSSSGELVAKSADGYTTYPIVIDCIPDKRCLPVPEVKNRSISRLEKVWAYLTLQQLLDKADALSEPADVNATKAKALDLALKYKFVTPLTSLIVVKPNETSSVETEQVRPGAIPPGAMYASFARPAASYGGAQPQFMLASAGAPGAGFSGGFYGPPPPMAPMAFYPSTTHKGFMSTLSQDIYGPDESDTSEKGTLDDLPWLFNYTTDNVTYSLPISGGEEKYLLGQNETDTAYGSCTLPDGGVGECRHLKYCVLSAFYVGIDEFLPYRCDINPSKYLGACCPLENTTTTIATPPLPPTTAVN